MGILEQKNCVRNSNSKIPEYARNFKNELRFKKNFHDFKQYINFCKSCFDDDDEPFIDPYPGFKNIYDDFELFCSKFKIKYEEGINSFWDYCTDNDSDSDSDGVNSDDLEVILSDSDSD